MSRDRKYIERNRVRLLACSLIFALCAAGVSFLGVTSIQKASQLREARSSAEQSLSAARGAIETGDLAVARQHVGKAQGSIGRYAERLPALTRLVAEVADEIDIRVEALRQYESFERQARQAMDDMFSGRVRDEYSVVAQEAEQTLKLYGILGDDDWDAKLEDAYLNEQQRAAVRQTAYETLLVLADHGIRWGTEEENAARAEASLRHLQRAEAFHPATRALYWVRKECFRLLGDEDATNANADLFDSTERCATLRTS